MPWQMSGNYYAPCSCKVSCPCELGEMVADQGWCSGTVVLDIRSGNVNGTNIGGTRVVLDADWPSGMLSGDGKGRLYFDPSVSQQQRSALESVLSGKMGGVWEILSSLVPTILPSREAAINITRQGDKTSIDVAGHGVLVIDPLKGTTGEFTRLLHGSAAFRDNVILAKGTGSRWQDPDMRSWESGGHAEQAEFDWSA